MNQTPLLSHELPICMFKYHDFICDYPWNKDVNGFVNVDTVEQITYENIMDAITLFKLFQL